MNAAKIATALRMIADALDESSAEAPKPRRRPERVHVRPADVDELAQARARQVLRKQGYA